MGQITFVLKDEAIAALRRDYDTFVRMSTSLDPRFVTPSFEDFLRARIMDNTVPLTEQAVSHLLKGSHYEWTRRTLEKEFPDVVAALMQKSAEHGFGLAVRADWTPDQLLGAARDLASAIVTEAGADSAVVDSLAQQIKSAAQNIQILEEQMQTPAWRLVDSLRQRVYESKTNCENAVGSQARERLGELRALLRLSIWAGVMQKREAQQILEYLRLLRPEIFVDEPYDIFSRLAAWLRAAFMPSAPRAVLSGQSQQPRQQAE
jgi:hypothetical protein